MIKETKVCSKCKISKSIDNFSKDKYKIDGLYCSCKECTKLYHNKYYINNKEKSLEYSKYYYNKNRNVVLERMKNNIDKEKRKIYAKLYREKNKDKLKAYFDSIKEDRKIYNKLYRMKNRNKLLLIERERSRKRYLSNKDYYREKCNRRQRELDSIKLFDNPFPEEIIINYHHINNKFIIPLPEKLHRYNPSNREIHRKKCEEIIFNLYGIDTERLLNGY